MIAHITNLAVASNPLPFFRVSLASLHARSARKVPAQYGGRPRVQSASPNSLCGSVYGANPFCIASLIDCLKARLFSPPPSFLLPVSKSVSSSIWRKSPLLPFLRGHLPILSLEAVPTRCAETSRRRSIPSCRWTSTFPLTPPSFLLGSLFKEMQASLD